MENNTKDHIMWNKEIRDTGGIPGTIMSRLSFHGGLSLEDLSQGLGVSKRTARKHVERLVKDGKVKQVSAYCDHPIYRLNYFGNEK